MRHHLAVGLPFRKRWHYTHDVPCTRVRRYTNAGHRLGSLHHQSVRYSARPGAQRGFAANRVVVGDPCGAITGFKPWALTDSMRTATGTRATPVRQSSNRRDPGGSESCVSPSPTGCGANRVDYHGSNPEAQPRRPSWASPFPGDGRAQCLSVTGFARLEKEAQDHGCGSQERLAADRFVASFL